MIEVIVKCLFIGAGLGALVGIGIKAKSQAAIDFDTGFEGLIRGIATQPSSVAPAKGGRDHVRAVH